MTQKIKQPVFSVPFFDFDNVEDNNQKARELYEKIKKTGDQRSKVVLSGIIIEYHLDRLLKTLLLDYNILTNKTGFTFSIKISLLESLRLIPIKIINSCDCIRQVRNTFAHNLDLDKIEDIDKKLISKIIQTYSEINPNGKNKELALKYDGIHFVTSGNLRSYEQNF